MSIWKWAEWLPQLATGTGISLGEGSTPIVPSRRIGPVAGLERLFFKLETTNPTGSFKDRFAAAAVSEMVGAGVRRCLATSSGNTGSALAAYCAVAGLPCHIVIVDTAPDNKLRQMQAYGAHLVKVRRFGSDPTITSAAFAHLEALGAQSDNALAVSAFRYSPVGMTGVQTISYELDEQLDGPIDHVFCPVGGGGLALAVARGFAKLVEVGKSPRTPAVQCVQPEGNDTVAGPLRDGHQKAREVVCASDISGLQVATRIDVDPLMTACRASGGTGHVVSDRDIWEAQRRLAREEGIFCEPAGAVALTGCLAAVERGEIRRDATIVCLVTGTGFKDGPSIDRMIGDTECLTINPDELDDHLA
ncbi:MAG: pyridoxal-phosphate dependent enzyme [Pirellulales bacterium]